MKSSAIVPAIFCLTATCFAAGSPVIGDYNCPSDNKALYKPRIVDGFGFKILCDRDWPIGAKGIEGGYVRDLQAVVATSIRNCVDICAINREMGGLCSAVAYGANITLALNRGGVYGNCFLKDQRGEADLVDESGQAQVAYLAWEDEKAGGH